MGPAHTSGRPANKPCCTSNCPRSRHGGHLHSLAAYLDVLLVKAVNVCSVASNAVFEISNGVTVHVFMLKGTDMLSQDGLGVIDCASVGSL